jgi:hypothetical protein
MARLTSRVKVYLVLLLAALVPVSLFLFTPSLVLGVADVITRDSTQTPCPAIDDITGECRNLRIKDSNKGLDVNLVGGTISLTGATGTQASITCLTTATTVLASNTNRRSWTAKSPTGNTADLFVGLTSGVTTANGLPVGVGGSVDDDSYTGAVFCIVASGTQNLRVLEVSQ